MLGLITPTDPRWLEAAEGNLPLLLQDHAQCELKAAHSALSLIGRHAAELPSMVEPLLALAREESEHVGMVHGHIHQRGFELGYPTSDKYVTQLMAAAKQERRNDVPPLLDRLLVAALIEGRSCERFRILADGLKDASLRAFYRDLMASEARHFTLFSQLAAEAFGSAESKARFETLALREGAICADLPLSPQVHG